VYWEKDIETINRQKDRIIDSLKFEIEKQEKAEKP